jgi:hypothetical protein
MALMLKPSGTLGLLVAPGRWLGDGHAWQDAAFGFGQVRLGAIELLVAAGLFAAGTQQQGQGQGGQC